MRLWILRGKKDKFADGMYDAYDGFVVAALDAKHARRIAAENGADEQEFTPGHGKYAKNPEPIDGWLDPKNATCRELRPEDFQGSASIDLSSFNAG